MTLTEEIEIRTTTDEEGNEEEYEYPHPLWISHLQSDRSPLTLKW